MNGEDKPLTDAEIGRYLKGAIEKSPTGQGELARRAGVGEQAASEYANSAGDSLSQRFKAVAFLIEIARSSRESFETLLPLFHQHEIPEPSDRELRELVEKLIVAWDSVPMRKRIRDAMDLALPERGQEPGEHHAAPARASDERPRFLKKRKGGH